MQYFLSNASSETLLVSLTDKIDAGLKLCETSAAGTSPQTWSMSSMRMPGKGIIKDVPPLIQFFTF